jgi:predicted O-methyltransferase YrrM
MVGEKDYQLFLKNIKDVRDRVTILKMTTREAVGRLPLGTFDMIFVDADHSFEGAKFDIVHFAPLLKPEGLLCGHDYNSKRWPGVIRAVKELAMKARVVHTIWWIKRPVGGFSWEISSDQS